MNESEETEMNVMEPDCNDEFWTPDIPELEAKYHDENEASKLSTTKAIIPAPATFISNRPFNLIQTKLQVGNTETEIVKENKNTLIRYKCEFCDFNGRNNEELTSHRQQSHYKPFKEAI